jgi:hypothetical protein
MAGDDNCPEQLVQLAYKVVDDLLAARRDDLGSLRLIVLNALLTVHEEASRAWLGSPLTRGRGDD